MYSSVSLFALLPIPMFVLMGEIMFHSGIAFRMMEALGQVVRARPRPAFPVGRRRGHTVRDAQRFLPWPAPAMLGEVLVPRMEAQGSQKQMTIGPILGSGTLAAMIPPSALGVLLASLAQISVAGFLLAIVIQESSWP